MITIKADDEIYGINFPTSLDEITPEILTKLTANINLPKNYCVIALAFNTKLFDFVAMVNGRKDTNVGVIPIMAKISDEDSAMINSSTGDRLIIYRSNLERGVHVNVNTVISSANAQSYFKRNPTLVKDIMMDKLHGAAKVYILEFKIIPINDISAAIKKDVTVIDSFIDIPKQAKIIN